MDFISNSLLFELFTGFDGIIYILALFVSIAIHEAAHAYSANYYGDNTPRIEGRLTLNPIAHLDLIGTIFILLFGIGWGRAVNVNPNNLDNPKKNMVLIALAGPMSNILFAIVLVLSLKMFAGFLVDTAYFVVLLRIVMINVLLAVFNLLPIYPLDGSKIVEGLLPYNLAEKFAETENFGILLLVLVITTDVLWVIMGPILFIVSAYLNFPL